VTATEERPVAEPPPAVGAPRLTNEAGRRRDLARMRRNASGLLVLMTVVWVVARLAEENGATWVGYLRAMAEAAMVGGLADWFAVTALFRHPLGVPIPHTAVIPHRKDQIGRSLGEFLQANFLSGPLVSERIAAARPGERIAGWLTRPESAEIVAHHLADAITAATEGLRDDEVQGALEDLVVSRLRNVPLAPAAGRLLGVATEGDRHQELLDAVLRGLDRLLVEQRDDLRARFDRESPWWVPDAVDERVFDKLHDGLRGFLGEVVADPRHEVRQHLDTRLHDLVERLQQDPELAARGEALKDELLGHPAFRQWTSSLWADVKASLAEQASDPESPLRERLEGAVTAFGERLASDPALQAKVDSALARLAGYVLEEYADTLSEMILSTVERWDPAVVTNQLELLLGRDLQFIRINGTVVGGLVGLGLHAVNQAIG
jgi:uncharacterized membrane-anchored protein YjiN (DUF445 family)